MRWALARRTKGNREHRVPWSGRALEILEEARRLGRGGSCSRACARCRRAGAPASRTCSRRRRWGGARVPVELSGLGGRGDGSSARGRWRRRWPTRCAIRSKQLRLGSARDAALRLRAVGARGAVAPVIRAATANKGEESVA